MDYTKQLFDIVIIAGQSNAEGNGISLDDFIVIPDKAYELVDTNDYTLELSGPNRGRPLCHIPVQVKVQKLQERGNYENSKADLSLGFAPLYISHCLDSNRKILFVKAAFGGTGFALGSQGVGKILYNRLIDMVNAALKLNSQNRIVALLWHQGEHDAYENAELNESARFDFYYNHLRAQLEAIRNQYKEFTFPIITGQFCHEWRDKPENIKQCIAVEDATKQVCKDIGNASFVTSENLRSNNQVINNGDDIHFSHDDVIELGRRYFKAYLKLRDKHV